MLEQARRLGVLLPVGNDQYEVTSPSLLAVAEEVVGRGISLQSALDVLGEIARHCDSVSRSFVKLFLGEVWKPFQQADMPPERWPEIEEAVERLTPDRLRGGDGDLPPAPLDPDRGWLPRDHAADRRREGGALSVADADEQRSALHDSWEQASAGWRRQADRTRTWGMPVSERMITAINPQPGQRVIELAAGPGDTGLMAAELLAPGGTLISTDFSQGMLDAARERAETLGVKGVEFKLSDLEWIDEATGSVDALLCRWGVMFALDQAACLRECRRVIRPGGRIAVAVWDVPEVNPWATVPMRALIELGHVAPDAAIASGPGPFATSEPGMLRELLEGAGFTGVEIEPVTLGRWADSVEDLLVELIDCSVGFSRAWTALDDAARDGVRAKLGELVVPFTADGRITLPGRSLVGTADA